MEEIKDRDELAEEFKWNLGSIYRTDDQWEEEFAEIENQLPKFEDFQGRVLEDGDSLLEVLGSRDEIFRKADRLFYYARMRSDEDTRNQKYQSMVSRARGLYAKVESRFSFIKPEIQAASCEEIENLIDRNPALKKYEHYLDDVLRLKPHTRDAEIESLVAELGEVLDAPGEIYNYLTNADLEFPSVEDPEGEEVELTLSNFVNLLQKKTRSFRKEVYTKFFDRFADVGNTISTAYSNSVRKDNKLAKIKNYDSARERALDENNIPVEVYDNLLNVIEDNLDLLHRHLVLKEEALGCDDLKMWDIYAPLPSSDSPDIPYDRAKDYVLNAVEPLGDDYRNQLEEGLESRWIDVYETPGKRAGAYSGGSYDTQPFILMNYKGDISSLYTLAHELGHSMHSKLTSEHQPYVYSDYSIFVAEVASTLHEALLTEYLLEEISDEDFRLHLLDQFLETFRSVLYRQALFAHFEQEVHEKEEAGAGLTRDSLSELFADLKGSYYEPVEIDERIKREWMRIPHFYRAYYVFQYSTGISASLALARNILDGEDSASDNYLEALKSGSSDYPLEILRTAGVDMSQPEPIKSALSLYEKYLGEVEAVI